MTRPMGPDKTIGKCLLHKGLEPGGISRSGQMNYRLVGKASAAGLELMAAS